MIAGVTLTALPGVAPVLLAARQRGVSEAIDRHQAGVDVATAEVEAALVRLADGLGAELNAWIAEGGIDVRGRVLSFQLADALDLIDDVIGDDDDPDGARSQWFARLRELSALAIETTGATGLPTERLDVESWSQIQRGALENASSAWDTNVKRVLGDSLLKAANEALYAKPNVVRQRIGDMVRDLTPNIIAEQMTSTAIYDRSMTAGIVADIDPNGDLLWIYAGPTDGIERPFCRAAGRDISFTRDQVGDLSNGQGMPVAEGCGGYRCRHRWIYMTPKQARANGYAPATAIDVAFANASARGGRKGRR